MYMSRGEHNVAVVVGYVFLTAAGKKHLEMKSEPSLRLLVLAAETLHQLLSEEKRSLITGAGGEECT